MHEGKHSVAAGPGNLWGHQRPPCCAQHQQLHRSCKTLGSHLQGPATSWEGGRKGTAPRLAKHPEHHPGTWQTSAQVPKGGVYAVQYKHKPGKQRAVQTCLESLCRDNTKFMFLQIPTKASPGLPFPYTAPLSAALPQLCFGSLGAWTLTAGCRFRVLPVSWDSGTPVLGACNNSLNPLLEQRAAHTHECSPFEMSPSLHDGCGTATLLGGPWGGLRGEMGEF